MNIPTSPETYEICAEIVSYLKSHPDAADNLHGIVSWWLVRQPHFRGAEQVKVALDILTENEAVEKIKNPDGTTIYRATRSGRNTGAIARM